MFLRGDVVEIFINRIPHHNTGMHRDSRVSVHLFLEIPSLISFKAINLDFNAMASIACSLIFHNMCSSFLSTLRANIHCFFLMLVFLRRTSFLTTFYGLYFNQWCTYILQITFHLWASEGSFHELRICSLSAFTNI